MDELLTTRQVAAELQVSESSVKRWCDQGLLETRRTAGGHRRIGRTCLEAFRRSFQYQLPEPGATTTLLADARESYRTLSREDLTRRFQNALLAGDEAQAHNLLEMWYQRYPSMAQVGDWLIAGTMDSVGRLWECGRAEVFEERRSCEICMRLLSDLRNRVPELAADAPKAIGGTVSGDHYTLANFLVELVLREAGWNATNLGCNLPLDTLLVAARRHRPRLLWLSISHVEDADAFVASYNAFYSQLPPEVSVAVGGRALTDQLRPRIGYTAHCDNLEQLSALAQVIAGAR